MTNAIALKALVLGMDPLSVKYVYAWNLSLPDSTSIINRRRSYICTSDV